ncbi:MAG: MgtC/SapB family protein [Gammaproteobacteria bacterium]|nr:MgtC/SapB family protein [Gammaproteobacteria bacterium]
MHPDVDITVIWNFATALLIGALLGIERERHKTEHDELTIGGLRTFILFTLIGALGGWLTLVLQSPWVLAVALLGALAPVLAGYVISARTQPDALGLTTELAAIAACLLGAMTTLGYRDLAVGLGVAVAALLAYKQPLHLIVRKLDREDIYAGLRLLIATFIILPLLPDRPVDPWGALNPRSLWMLVLLISSLSLVGYVATRLLGAHRGIPLTGVTGGLVSSTAVTLAFARQSRDAAYASAGAALASGILLAWTVMFVRVLVMVLVVNRALLPPLAVPFAAMAVVTLAIAWLLGGRRGTRSQTEGVPLKNPFSLTAAAKFAAFFALVLLVVKIVQAYAPDRGVYVVAALAGTTDVDAITLSMAQYAKTGVAAIAVKAITIATLTNTVVKTAMVSALASSSLKKPIVLASVAVLATGAVALLLG